MDMYYLVWYLNLLKWEKMYLSDRLYEMEAHLLCF